MQLIVRGYLLKKDVFCQFPVLTKLPHEDITIKNKQNTMLTEIMTNSTTVPFFNLFFVGTLLYICFTVSSSHF